MWNVDTDTYQLYEAFGNDQYHVVYTDQGQMNFFDLDEDGQHELVKIHEDEATMEQWITIHEWDSVDLDANLNGGFTDATKTTNRFERSIWNNMAEGYGNDMGLLDFVKLDGDDDWDIFAVDAELTFFGGQLVNWRDGTIMNVLEMTNFEADSPLVELRYTSGPIGDGMLFFGIWNNYVDVDKDGLTDILLVSDHAQSLMGIRTAGNDNYDPIVISMLPDVGFYHIPTFPIVADFDNDEEDEIYFTDRDGQVWFMHTTGDFESTLAPYNIYYLARIVQKQNTAGALNMTINGHVGDQDGDGKPNIYYTSKDISSLIDVEYQGGWAGDSTSFTYTYTDLHFTNGDLMTATMWNMQTGTRYRNPLLDMDRDNKREIILGGPDSDYMVWNDLPTVYIYESVHEVQTKVADETVDIPEKFKLFQNYPNPFNPGTMIQYSIANPGPVEIQIFNIIGEEVRRFESEHEAPGMFSYYWDGTDKTGMRVPSGMYFYRITHDGISLHKKMILQK